LLDINGLHPAAVDQIGQVGHDLWLGEAMAGFEFTLGVADLDGGSFLAKAAGGGSVTVIEVPKDLGSDRIVRVIRHLRSRSRDARTGRPRIVTRGGTRQISRS